MAGETFFTHLKRTGFQIMNFQELNSVINENSSRYSVEVNYRTTATEMKEGFAKLVLTYISAALKQKGYHVKKVLDQPPMRIIASANKWTPGEWVFIVSYHPKVDCFVISKGYYNKDRDTVTIPDDQPNERCRGESAADIFKMLYDKMESIKDEPPAYVGGLKGVKGKTGPKQGSMRPTQKYDISKDIQPGNDDKMGM